MVEGTSLELSAALFPHYVPKQEQSSIHKQSRNLYFPPKTSWNSSSQGVLELSGLGLQDPPHFSSVSLDHWGLSGVQKLFCWEFKSFCFPQASSLEFVLGWMHLQDAEIPEFHLGMPWGEQGCSQGCGAGSFLSVQVLCHGQTSGRLSPAEKLLPQTLISQVHLCCVPPSLPAGRDKPEKAKCGPGCALLEWRLENVRLWFNLFFFFPLLHRQLNWGWHLPITPISSLIW